MAPTGEDLKKIFVRNARLLGSRLHFGVIIILVLLGCILWLPYSHAVKAWTIIGLNLSLIVLAAGVSTQLRTFSSFFLLGTSYSLAVLAYNLSIRNTSSDTYSAIMQTFDYEALLFSGAQGEIPISISIIFLVAALILLINSKLRRVGRSTTEVGTLIVVILAVPMLLLSFFTEIPKFYVAIHEVSRERALFRRMTPEVLAPAIKSAGQRDLAVVVIIGESTSKWNVSLYGYPRDTFAPLRDVQNLLVFKDVVAPHVHTVPSLNLALTSANFPRASQRGNLFEPPPRSLNPASPDVSDHWSITPLSLAISRHWCMFIQNASPSCRNGIQERNDIDILLASNLFDPVWYLNKYPDALKEWTETNLDPAMHYFRHGARRGFNPSARFSTNAYLQRYPDIAASGTNPLLHYLKTGLREGRTITAADPNDTGDPEYYKELDFAVKPLIGVLNAAGIQTYWFSNQNEFGLWDNPVSHHGKMAHNWYFHRKSVGVDFKDDYFDRDLVSIALSRVEELPRRAAMFLHFYESHYPYCTTATSPGRWGNDLINSLPNPAIFGKFTQTDKHDLNCYDSAVLSVAENVKRVVDWVDNQYRPVILVYFSDHGDDVFANKGHDSSKFTHKMAEVPLLIYFNGEALKDYGDIFNTLKQNTSQPVNLDHVFDFIVDLFELRLDGAVVERSIASRDFKSSNRFILDRGDIGNVSYDKVPESSNDLADAYVDMKRKLASLDPLQRRKVCAHRNNSLLKFMEAISLFDCVEIDVVLTKSTCMVHHDIDDPSGLPLETLLGLDATKSKRIWVDVKNLSDSNVSLLLDILKRFKRSSDDTLVEVAATTAGSTAVKKLAEAGFSVSYYLPTELGIKCSNELSTGECAVFASKVETDLRQSGFKSLSFDIEASRFVSQLKIPERVSLSTWHLGTDPSVLNNRSDLGRYNMYIVPFASNYDH